MNSSNNYRNNYRNQPPPRLEIPQRRLSFSDSDTDSTTSDVNDPSLICDCQIRETNGMTRHFEVSDGIGCSTWLNRYLRENGLTDVAKISFYFSGDPISHSLILRRYDYDGQGDPRVMFGIEFSSDDNESQSDDYAALQQFIASSPNLDDRLGLHIRRPSFVVA